MEWNRELERYERHLARARKDGRVRGSIIAYLRALGERYEPTSFLELTQDQILGYVDALRERGLRREEGLSEGSLRSVLGWIRSLLLFLNDGERPASIKNITIGKAGSRVQSGRDLMTDEELDRFLAACNPQWRVAFALMAASGGRPSEVLRLRTRDATVETKGGREFAMLTFRDTKNGETRDVPVVDPTAVEALKEWLKVKPESTWLFPSPRGDKDGPLGHQAAWRYMTRTGERLGMDKNLYPYLLRHSRATSIFHAPDPVRNAVMGWNSDAQWRNYTHVANDDVVDWMLEHEGEPEAAPAERVEELVRENERLRRELAEMKGDLQTLMNWAAEMELERDSNPGSAVDHGRDEGGDEE